MIENERYSHKKWAYEWYGIFENFSNIYKNLKYSHPLHFKLITMLLAMVTSE